MTGPVETSAAIVVVLCVAVGAMIVLPTPKPDAPAEKQIPAEELAKLEETGTQPGGVNASVDQRTDEAKMDSIEQRLQEIQAKVSRIEKKANEPRRD